MRTAKQNSPAKKKLLDAAQHLVLTKGFMGTTVDDICRSAKLTKGSFFHYFESKDDLGFKLLERYCADSREAFHLGCCAAEKDPLKRVYGFLDFMIRMAKEKGGKGCLLGSMAQELSDTHPDIRNLCAKGFAGMAEHLRHDLAQAKKIHVPKTAFDPKELADHFVAILEGTMLLARVRQDKRIKTSSLLHFKQYLKSLFGK